MPPVVKASKRRGDKKESSRLISSYANAAHATNPPPPAPASAIPDEPPRKRRKHQDDQSLVSDTHGLACGSESKAKDKEEERLILVSSNEPDADIARGFESDDDGTLPRSVEVDHDLDSMLDQDAEVEDSDGSITDFEEEFDMDI